MSEDDYNKFIEGGGTAEDLIKKYLSKEEAEQLESWDKEEVDNSNTYDLLHQIRRHSIM